GPRMTANTDRPRAWLDAPPVDGTVTSQEARSGSAAHLGPHRSGRGVAVLTQPMAVSGLRHVAASWTEARRPDQPRRVLGDRTDPRGARRGARAVAQPARLARIWAAWISACSAERSGHCSAASA